MRGDISPIGLRISDNLRRLFALQPNLFATKEQGRRFSSDLEDRTKWLQATRLETRTKESKMCASVWVLKTETRNESKTGGKALAPAPSADHDLR